jgi:hypothetical protein
MSLSSRRIGEKDAKSPQMLSGCFLDLRLPLIELGATSARFTPTVPDLGAHSPLSCGNVQDSNFAVEELSSMFAKALGHGSPRHSTSQD